MIRSIEASKYIQMPFFRFRKTDTKKKYKRVVKPVSKSKKSKDLRKKQKCVKKEIANTFQNKC